MDKNKIREALEVGLNYVLNAGYSRHKDVEEKEIKEALAELDTDDWIKVTDRLPETECRVLIFSEYGRELVTFNPTDNCWDDSDGDDYYRDIEWASHWQQLPSNPKE